MSLGGAKNAPIMRTTTIAVGLLLAALALTACDEEDFFMECPLSESIIEVCEAQSDATTLTCVVERHPMCDERVCAKWQGSDAFCSRVCTADEECPAGSTCQGYLDFGFCVPDEIVNPAQATVQ